MDLAKHPHKQATAGLKLSFLYPEDTAGSMIEIYFLNVKVELAELPHQLAGTESKLRFKK
jgi:hypothetical protein